MGLLQKIGNFGDGSAEDDDAVLSYFLKTDAVDNIERGESYVVIGRKGSGKTALVKYFSVARNDYVSESPSLRDYPWTLHSTRKNLGASDIESYVSSWRYLIAVKANSVILQSKGVKLGTDQQLAARNFLTENYGGITPELRDILAPKRLKVTKKTFAPQIMGNTLGSIDIETTEGGLSSEIDILTDALLMNAKDIASQTGISHIDIHFDELDQGLASLDERHREMITGLILATRSIRNDKKVSGAIRPVCYIRTDIWDELSFSDKNKISQSSAVALEWTPQTLLDMVNQRIRVKLGAKYSWDDLDDEKVMRGSQTKWSHIVARTFLRPRDVISFLNFATDTAIKLAPDSDFFDNDDIQSARPAYSRYLKQELDDEIGPHWEKWIEGLQACSELVTITFSRDKFVEAYNRRRSPKNELDADEALASLYNFSVVGYRRGIGSGGSGWVFQYMDPDAGWDNGASKFKVHLGLKEFAKLREERGGA
jgi:energy-coupling factor transporter ATP-binding protein EcfA2